MASPSRPVGPTASPGSALTAREIRSIIWGLALAMLLAALDQTIVATAMPTIGHSLGDFEDLPWIVTTYLLASTAVTPLYGKVSDIVGRRITLLVAITVFIVGSIACALAPTMLALILARALQGLGGGGLISLAQTVVADVVSPRERARYQGLFAGVFGTSSIAGPVLGGLMAEKLHWSAIFWINLPLGLIAVAMTASLLKKLPRHEKPHRLDLLGAGLMTLATVALLLALSLGGHQYPWGSPRILGLVGLSVLLWGAFIWRLRTAPEPLIPIEILRNPVVSHATVAACFAMGVFIGLSIYTPIFLQGVYGLSASQSGLALIPLMAGTTIGATTASRLMPRLQHYKRIPLIGLSISAAVLAILAVWPHTLPFVALEALLALATIGIGPVLPVTTVSIQNAVLPHQMGTATGVMSFFRSLGGALVVAAFGAIVMGSLPPDRTTGVTMENLAALLATGGSDIGLVFRLVFGAATAGILVGLFHIARMEERPLRNTVQPAAEKAAGNE
ncbi:MAG: MFS transporter [Alphaproteobacteria bacterium]|nr:MFS transporter [Alphaproteobacteria bacterium]